MTYARIIGTGSYVPQKVLTNNELSRMIGEDIDEFVSNVIGIKERHICGVDESTADLAEAASKKALESAGITAGDLDLIILATDTPCLLYTSDAADERSSVDLGGRRI